MNGDDKVRIERQEHVLLMALNRPDQRNLFDMDMLFALAQADGELEADPELRCGVVVAEGKYFTLGLELPTVLPALAQQGELRFPEGSIDPWGLQPPYRSKPVIVAAHGLCLTLGIELLLAADIRLAAAGTRFSQMEIKRGIFPFGGATVRFVREAGWGNAMRYLLTGDEFDAGEALRVGLVQEVVEPGRLRPRALELAATVSAQAPLGVQATVRSARQALVEGEPAALQALFPAVQQLFATDDAAEGMRSFIERREARFAGR
ncbi:MAG: crotonase/enoyl-CoA hydratase family protein [Nitrososphaerales archaeon]